MSTGSTAAEKAKWKKLRATPRRLTPEELHRRAVGRQTQNQHVVMLRAELAKAAKAGEAERRLKRKLARRKAYDEALIRERALGIAPVYRGFARSSGAQKQWARAAKAWDASQRQFQRQAA